MIRACSLITTNRAGRAIWRPGGKNIKFGIRDLHIKLLRICKLLANLIRKASTSVTGTNKLELQLYHKTVQHSGSKEYLGYVSAPHQNRVTKCEFTFLSECPHIVGLQCRCPMQNFSQTLESICPQCLALRGPPPPQVALLEGIRSLQWQGH